MKVRFSLQTRILLGLSILAAALLCVLWTVVRQKLESRAVSEHETILRQTQSSAIESLDEQFSEWTSATRSLAWEVSEHPREGEQLLRSAIALFPEIVQIKIQSQELPDEASSQNTAYPVPDFKPAEQDFIPSGDSLVQYVWRTAASASPAQSIVMRINFRISGKPFVMRVIWDAKSLQRDVEKLSSGTGSYVCLYSKEGAIFENRPETGFARTQQRISGLQTVKISGIDWCVFTAPVQSAGLTILTAVPERTIPQPAHRFLFFVSLCLLGLFVLLYLFGWLLSYQINHPVALLVKDLKRMAYLDFEQPVRIPKMRNLHAAGETIESMRLALERFRRLNMEKIVLEEWKNKLLINHSDDAIGMTGGGQEFVFRNAAFDELCLLLSPSRVLTTKDDVLRHSAIKKIQEISSTETAEMLTTVLVRSEVKIQIEKDRAKHYSIDEYSIFRENENISSLIFFHDLTNERMVEKMKTETMSVIARELHNPVSGIVGFSDIMLNDQAVTAVESREYMTRIMDSAKKLNSLINRSLDITRLELRRAEYPKKPTDCGACIRDAVKSRQPQLLHKSLTTEIDIAEDVPPIVVVPDLFRDAVLHLLSNAIKFGDPNRTIVLKLSKTDYDVVFSITDHGFGIPPEAQEKLFSKFYRVPIGKSVKEAGAGLGLAYVREIAAYHNGSIALESNPEIGCRFTLTIPIVMEESVQ